MRASVVINTYNRAASLKTTLDALRYQTFESFEVIVVNGPSTDGTEPLIQTYGHGLRIAHCPEPHLAKSRNVGIAAASGDIVAFIDDDAVPEPTWLAAIMSGYDSPRVGGVGGFVYDTTGFDFQWRHASCSRLGNVRVDVTPPLAGLMTPGADPFVYLQGTNCSFRRTCLVEAGGFDEGLAHYYDDSDTSGRIIDLGYELRILPHALVHHKTLLNRTRDQARVVVSPFAIVADHAYFALRHAAGTHPRPEILRSIERFADGLCAAADEHVRAGRMTAAQHKRFLQEVSEGIAAGVARGTEGAPARSRIPDPDPAAFRALERVVPEGPRLHVCLLSQECPPADTGGVGRFTFELACGLAEMGHTVRLITGSRDEGRVDFADGVWFHRLPPWNRFIPELDDVPLRFNLYQIAAAYHEVCRIHDTMPVDLVSAPLWLCEGLLCSLDRRFPTVLALQTAMKTIADMHPSWSDTIQIHELIALERATIQRARYLHANSGGVLEKMRGEYEMPADGSFILPHGIGDRGHAVVRQARTDRVRVLFVSRLERRKGVDLLLEAAVPLLRELPQLELVLVGKDTPNTEMAGTYRTTFERAHSEDPDLTRRVQFTGEVSEAVLDQWYADADIFCVPSRFESFGLVFVEAMMFGLPIVATNTGGIPEVVEHEGNGLLVDPEDVTALREALRRLVVDPKIRLAYGRRSRERYEETFTRAAMARASVPVYRTIVAAHRETAGPAAGGQASPEQPIAVDELAQAISEATGLSTGVAARAALSLVDRSTYPMDYIAESRRLWKEPDREFVAGLYRLLLGREASGADAAPHLGMLATGGTRLEVVRAIALSDEARARGIPTAWLESLGAASETFPRSVLPLGAWRRRATSWVRQRPRLALLARYVMLGLRLPWQSERIYAACLEQQRQLAEQRRELRELAAIVRALAEDKSPSASPPAEKPEPTAP